MKRRRRRGSFVSSMICHFLREILLLLVFQKEYCSVTYENCDYLVSLLTLIGPGCFIAKADLQSAFRIIPVHPDDDRLLGSPLPVVWVRMLVFTWSLFLESYNVISLCINVSQQVSGSKVTGLHHGKRVV